MSNDLNKTLSERGSSYGDFTDNAQVAQQLKNAVRTGRAWVNATGAQREAIDMILSKISRLVTGDPAHKDSWHDIQGYAKLAEERLPPPSPITYEGSMFVDPAEWSEVYRLIPPTPPYGCK